jgi:hypothetical protein
MGRSGVADEAGASAQHGGVGSCTSTPNSRPPHTTHTHTALAVEQGGSLRPMMARPCTPASLPSPPPLSQLPARTGRVAVRLYVWASALGGRPPSADVSSISGSSEEEGTGVRPRGRGHEVKHPHGTAWAGSQHGPQQIDGVRLGCRARLWFRPVAGRGL